jgi:hypothetical protein
LNHFTRPVNFDALVSADVEVSAATGVVVTVVVAAEAKCKGVSILIYCERLLIRRCVYISLNHFEYKII